MDNNFNDILLTNEEIIKIFKPDKKRYYFGKISGFLFITIIFYMTLIINVFREEPFNKIVFSFLTGTYILIFVIFLLFLKLAFNKRAYCYTNKRLIIKHGIIGIDYKSLDLIDINAYRVNVGVLDKILKKKTGSIRFGSKSNPMVNNENKTNVFSFDYIRDPYNVYKELNEWIESIQNKKEGRE